VVSGVAPETVMAWIANQIIRFKKIAVSRAIRRDAELNPRDVGAKSGFQLPLQNFADERGTGFAFGKFHHLAFK